MCVVGGRRKFRGVDNLSVSGEEYVGGYQELMKFLEEEQLAE